MTEETVEQSTEQNNNVQISIEQICASIIATLGTVEVKLEDLIKNYSDKSIAINQDPETKAITFTLADTPVEQPADAEQDAAE